MKADEQQIIRKILNGEKERFGELLALYGDKVLSFVSAAVPNRHDAEDIAEEAFVNAYIHLHQFNANKASFYTWIRSIAWHEIVKAHHKPLPQPLSKGEGSEEDEGNERLDLLSECIDELTTEQQMLLKLYYNDDLPLKEIAVILDSKAENLANQLARLRKKLERMILEKEKKTTY